MTPLDSKHQTGRAGSPMRGVGGSVVGVGGSVVGVGGSVVSGGGSVVSGGSSVVLNRKMYYVYVLKSEKDGNFYVGFTCDLDRRLGEHDRGENSSTSWRRPFVLVYCEVCFDGRDAIHREKYLKTSWGKKYIKNRIKNYLGRTLLDNRLTSNGARVKNE